MIGYIVNDKFRIDKQLGKGGFGVTYLAYDLINERKVAIKEYLPSSIAFHNAEKNIVELYNPEDAKQFEKGMKATLVEARILAKLENVSNIVRVYDCFEAMGTAFVVMEYVLGTPLDKYISNGTGIYSFEEAWSLLRPAVLAMNRVHEEGIIHRDLTPSNIMVLEDGSVKIIDFGAGRDYQGDKTMTVMVKRGYAPPEQYEAKAKQGKYTDVYSICAIIYELITCVIPDGAIERIEYDTLEIPTLYGAELSPEQEQALMKGLELDPEKRIPDMAALAKAFDEGVIEESQANSSSRSRLAIIIGSLAAVILVLGLLFVVAPDFRVLLTGTGSDENVLYSNSQLPYQTGEREKLYETVKKNTSSVETYGEGDTADLYYKIKYEKIAKYLAPNYSENILVNADDLIEQLETQGYKLELVKAKSVEGEIYYSSLSGNIRFSFEDRRSYLVDNSIELVLYVSQVDNRIAYCLFRASNSEKSELESFKDKMMDIICPFPLDSLRTDTNEAIWVENGEDHCIMTTQNSDINYKNFSDFKNVTITKKNVLYAIF